MQTSLCVLPCGAPFMIPLLLPCAFQEPCCPHLSYLYLYLWVCICRTVGLLPAFMLNILPPLRSHLL